MRANRRLQLVATAETAELWIYDEIGDDGWGGGITAKDIVNQLEKMTDIQTIKVYINSPGGSVFDALAIYNVLNRKKVKCAIYIDGVALSAASVVAMAGDEIHMAENALLMIHDPIGLSWGNADDMRSLAALLDKAAETLVTTYASRTGQSEAQIREWMKAETWFDAEEALDAGFVTEIVEAKKVAACGDLSKFKNVPTTLLARLGTGTAPAETVAAETSEGEVTMTEDEKKKLAADAKAEGAKAESDRMAELHAAFPNDLPFAVAQFQAGASLIEAKAAYADVLAERNAKLTEDLKEAKKMPPGRVASGCATLGNGGGKPENANDYGDPVALVAERIQSLMARGTSRQDAMRTVFKADRELHEAYMRATNAHKGADVSAMIDKRFAAVA